MAARHDPNVLPGHLGDAVLVPTLSLREALRMSASPKKIAGRALSLPPGTSPGSPAGSYCELELGPTSPKFCTSEERAGNAEVSTIAGCPRRLRALRTPTGVDNGPVG